MTCWALMNVHQVAKDHKKGTCNNHTLLTPKKFAKHSMFLRLAKVNNHYKCKRGVIYIEKPKELASLSVTQTFSDSSIY